MSAELICLWIGGSGPELHRQPRSILGFLPASRGPPAIERPAFDVRVSQFLSLVLFEVLRELFRSLFLVSWSRAAANVRVSASWRCRLACVLQFRQQDGPQLCL